MSHSNVIPPNSTGAPLGSIQDFIPIYKRFLAQHSKEVSDGEDMLNLGAKTELIQELEKFVANPVEALIASHNTTGQALIKVVEQILSVFFKAAHENNIIAHVFKIPAEKKSLSYGVILNEDTFEARESILDFLNLYSTFNFAEKVPVYIQFIPEKLASAFGNVSYVL